MKRSARLFAIAEHLRARKTGVTAEALAQRFGVSVRTMYRDLDTLQEATLPVKAERGRGGGYALDKSYFLPPIALSAREAAVLVTLAEHALQMGLVPFSSTTQSALDKLRAALSSSSQRELLDVIARLQFTGVPALPVVPTARAAIETAMFEGAMLRVVYEGSRGTTTRRITIRNVVMEGSVTLLNTTDVDTREERQLRLDRLTSIEVVAADDDPGAFEDVVVDGRRLV
ncbi:MAG TPA: HTH domain-containing protein [Myxococcota bacterium]